VVLVFLLIGVGYLFYVNYRSRTYQTLRVRPIGDIVRLRLARGEITFELEELKKTLNK
jgi:uncharacterized membrane protein